jgi:N6-adenosine-specific RNA methylase IME4
MTPQQLVDLRPAGGFACILADPPWQTKRWSEKGMGRNPDGPAPGYHVTARGYGRSSKTAHAPERHYRTMALDELKALPVPLVAADNCVLLMWAIDSHLRQAMDLAEHWGFAYKTVGFYWAKQRRTTSTRGRRFADWAHRIFPMSTGYWTRANPEQCLLFTRGKPGRLPDATDIRKLVVAPRREHSRKPDRVIRDIERLVAGPRLEMFARTARPGWAAWGDEVGRFDAAA